MRNRRLVLVVAATAGVAGACAASIDPAAPPDQSWFSRSQILQGARLAALGNCMTCHTSEEGKPFAGGRPLRTQFGTLYGTNITPDPETGIGRWSQDAFRRAMRRGVDREGRHLYPAFPYSHYTKMTDDDIGAIYAYLMTREPVRAGNRAHELPFPVNMRVLLAGWKALYLDEGEYRPAAGESEEWNRGAYLVEGVAHCGACHTPRNLAGAEKKTEKLAGGEAEGWHAAALTAASPAPVPWTNESLFNYLRAGWDKDHGVAAGPMKEVVANLGLVPDTDLAAMAAYIQAIGGEPTAERQRQGQELVSRSRGVESADASRVDPGNPDGRAIYAAACAGCHENGRDLPLALSTSLHVKEPGNLIRFVLDGIDPGEGLAGRSMPGFAGALTDAQVAAVVNYLRQEVAGKARWAALEDKVHGMRKGTSR